MITADRQQVLDRFQLTSNVMSKLDIYVGLLEEWQAKMNLVSESTLPVVWTRHILDSVQVYQYISPAKTVFDLGSGAGFPGLVMAIMDENQKLDIHLAESDGKKCQFLKAVAEECGLKISIHNERIENIKPFPVDLLTARALASLDKLLAYSSPFIGKQTRALFLKGKKAPEEIKTASKKWQFALDKYPSVSSEEGQILIFSGVKKK